MHGLHRGILIVGLMAAGFSLEAHAGDRTVRASLNTELQSLDPVYASVNATRVFSYLVFDTLIAIDNEGLYHPQMLEGWEISSDRMSYRFHLRDGLVWSDGTPVTAEDCITSIQRWAKRESFGGQLIDATKDFQIVDAKTFDLHLNRPFAFVIEALGKPASSFR
jgi:peptide/nickel transport system substrate-binding protein